MFKKLKRLINAEEIQRVENELAEAIAYKEGVNALLKKAVVDGNVDAAFGFASYVSEYEIKIAKLRGELEGLQ